MLAPFRVLAGYIPAPSCRREGAAARPGTNCGAPPSHDTTGTVALPLVSVAYKATLVDGLACVECEQQFLNNEPRDVATAVYEFALPPAAVVVDFHAALSDGRTLTASLRSKAEVCARVSHRASVLHVASVPGRERAASGCS